MNEGYFKIFFTVIVALVSFCMWKAGQVLRGLIKFDDVPVMSSMVGRHTVFVLVMLTISSILLIASTLTGKAVVWSFLLTIAVLIVSLVYVKLTDKAWKEQLKHGIGSKPPKEDK